MQFTNKHTETHLNENISNFKKNKFVNTNGKIKAIQQIMEMILQIQANILQKSTLNIKKLPTNDSILHSIVILLQGDLGAGKTTFAQMLIKAMTNTKEHITSPTFPIVQYYESHNEQFPNIWHYDLYRIKNDKEIWNIGIDDSLLNGISIIEWPENAPPLSEIEKKLNIQIIPIYVNLYVKNNDYITETHQL